jgi:hypothetical protein
MNLENIKNLDRLILAGLAGFYFLAGFIFITVKKTGWLSFIKIRK